MRGALVAAVAASLGACALATIGSGSAPTTFDLNGVPAEGNYGRMKGQLAVREPRALQVLDSERIVFRPSPSLVTYFSGAQWSDRLPKLFEARLIEAFGSAGRIGTVTRSADGLAVDYQLLSDIREFEVVKLASGGEVARISIFAQIIADPRSRALAGRLFEAHVPVQGVGVSAGVAALNEGMSTVLTEIVRWTLNKV